MAGKQLTVIATITAKKGMEDRVKKELLSLVKPTRSEAPCINYDLHQSTDNKAVFVFYENWTSKEDLDKHLAMPYLKAFGAMADEVLAKPMEVELWEMISEKQ